MGQNGFIPLELEVLHDQSINSSGHIDDVAFSSHNSKRHLKNLR